MVRSSLAEIFVESSQTNNICLPTISAYTHLGYKSREQLLRGIKLGLFRVGIEVEDRRGKNSQRPNYYWDIKKCKQRLAQPPEKRN